MAKPDLAHIGYHRTGTNFLQNEVFPSLADAIFMPRSAGARFYHAANGLEDARAYYAQEQETNLDDKPFLISYEGLTGTLERDDFGPAERLKQLNPGMRIILVLRSQYEILPSLYHLHIKNRGELDYGGFVERAISGGKCRYGSMVERLHALFGRDAVKVLLYEDLKRSPRNFIEELCRFLEAPCLSLSDEGQRVNARPSDAGLRARRAVNRSLGDSAQGTLWGRAVYDVAGRAADKLDDWSRSLSGAPLAPLERDEANRLIREAYAEDNRRLVDLVGRPLCDYGYPH